MSYVPFNIKCHKMKSKAFDGEILYKMIWSILVSKEKFCLQQLQQLIHFMLKT